MATVSFPCTATATGSSVLTMVLRAWPRRRRGRSAVRQAAWWLLIIAAFAACAASAEEPFVYRAERGDTLIGLGKRLLAVPAQWRSLQKLNRIGDPRRIPVGSEIRIPV